MIVKKLHRPDNPVPPGSYLAEFVRIEGKKLPRGGEGFIATFCIAEGPHAGRHVTALSGPFMEGSEIERWCGMAGVTVGIGEEVDVEDVLKGLRIRLRTTLVKRGERQYANGEVIGRGDERP